ARHREPDGGVEAGRDPLRHRVRRPRRLPVHPRRDRERGDGGRREPAGAHGREDRRRRGRRVPRERARQGGAGGRDDEPHLRVVGAGAGRRGRRAGREPRRVGPGGRGRGLCGRRRDGRPRAGGEALMPQTAAEKVLSRKAGYAVEAGDIAVVPVDGAMATDATAPFAIKAFESMGGARVWDPARMALVLDHATPAPNERISTLHTLMRRFAAEQRLRLYEVGDGICHQLMMENGHVAPGELFVGADSHTPTLGAVGAFAVGVGSTDLAAVMHTGRIWLKVPRTLRVELTGSLRPGTYAKDVILHLVGALGIAGATYEAVEFAGPTVAGMTLASRMVL